MINLRFIQYKQKNLWDNLDINFSHKTINASSRKLAASFSLEAIEDIQSLHIIDLKKDMLNNLIDEVNSELSTS